MADPISKADKAVDRLGKLVPAEVTLLYMSVRGLYSVSPAKEKDVILLIAAIAIAVCGIVFLRFSKKIDNWNHIAIYTAIFVIWMMTVDASLIDRRLFAGDGSFILAISMISLIVSFATPIVVSSASLASVDNQGKD
jgi:drug/metabolite transporter (DMT)-like permease